MLCAMLSLVTVSADIHTTRCFISFTVSDNYTPICLQDSTVYARFFLSSVF